MFWNCLHVNMTFVVCEHYFSQGALFSLIMAGLKFAQIWMSFPSLSTICWRHPDEMVCTKLARNPGLAVGTGLSPSSYPSS